MGEIINFSSRAKSKKLNNDILSKQQNETTILDPTASRLDKTEKDSYEKACKLAGKDHLARTIILTVLDYATPLDDAIMEIINDIGLYEKRIPLLYWASNSSPFEFIHNVTNLHRQKVPKEEVAKSKTKQDFLILLEKYKDENENEYEYYDDGG